MKLKLLSWNVRGLNDPKKREVLKNWLTEWKVDVVCLQETKLDKVDWKVIQSIWGNRFAGWEVLNAEHTAGGDLLLWDKRVLELTDSKVGTFSVSCCWKGIIDGFEWVGTGVYGPNRDDIRSDLWDELRMFVSSGPFRGVFLVTSMWSRFPSERRGCTRVSPSMVEFSDFIEVKTWWIYLKWGVNIRGAMGQPIHPCLGLIEYWFLRIGRSTTLMWFRS
jgi:hypothetical protein